MSTNNKNCFRTSWKHKFGEQENAKNVIAFKIYLQFQCQMIKLFNLKMYGEWEKNTTVTQASLFLFRSVHTFATQRTFFTKQKREVNLYYYVQRHCKPVIYIVSWLAPTKDNVLYESFTFFNATEHDENMIKVINTRERERKKNLVKLMVWRIFFYFGMKVWTGSWRPSNLTIGMINK